MDHGSSPAAAAWEAVAAATRIGEGTTVLDVGCGTGGFCRHAANRGALVHGADADAGRIAAARRAVASGDFRVARLERLPWAGGTFDVVTGFNVFQYAPDIDAALLEARRVARSSGCVVSCKWGPPVTNEFFAFLGALDPLRMRLGAAPEMDVVDAALARLGVVVSSAGDVPAPIVLPGDDALMAALVSAGARRLTEDEAGWQARVAAAAAPYRQDDGAYRFANRLIYRVFAA